MRFRCQTCFSEFENEECPEKCPVCGHHSGLNLIGGKVVSEPVGDPLATLAPDPETPPEVTQNGLTTTEEAAPDIKPT